MIRLYAEGKKYQALCQELKDAQSQLDKCNRLLKKGKTAFRSTSVSNANKEVLDIISEMKELKTQICNSDEFKKLMIAARKYIHYTSLTMKLIQKSKPLAI